MIERITAHFAARHALCLSSHTDALFHVYDPEGNHPCRHRVDAPQETDLAVHNPAAALVHLVAIDHCLYSSGDATRCDCALVCGEEIHFVEFKHGNYRRRTDRIKDCILQLAAAINDFLQVGIIAPHSAVQAIACVGFTEQRPPQGAAIEARKLQLNKLVGNSVAVELLVTDHIVFGKIEKAP
ncbi:hypothetical protein HHL22_18090 [Hymenobacter sp. RP-2-7]|uniref:NERD domain-containing protein n=1 Tax=Hymenobacter polaris TaxID=2682546 RepID=A0A7Y0AH01_9BACT|nr:hypothetical protein [Hymenobacter polaris]NML67119.1 hypothetical protein [Hymenobacter polaris]